MIQNVMRALCAVLLVGISGVASGQSYDYWLLVASWQPGFCVTHDVPECKRLAGTYAASNFSLHGLWPNRYDGEHPFYCGVPQSDIDMDQRHTWCSMDAYPVSGAVRQRLNEYMPGTASCLDQHEWFKHGTCAQASPDQYWTEATNLVSRLGGTSFNAFLQTHAGERVTRDQLLAAFENAFGSGTQSAVSLKCSRSGGVSYFAEAWIALKVGATRQFPSRTSLVTDGNIQSNCPASSIFIARQR